MASFVSAAAVRDRSLDDVAAAIRDYAVEHKVECETIEVQQREAPAAEAPERLPLLTRLLHMVKPPEEKKVEPVGQGRADVVVFPPEAGWTVLLWPPLFTGQDVQAARWLSRKLQAVVSDIHVHESNYWAHYLFDKGKEVDRFASFPDFAAENPGVGAVLKKRWAGNPQAVAETLGVAPELVERYYAQVDPDMRRRRDGEDRFSLDDPWVFTDFWCAVGITYPEDTQGFERQLCFGPDFDESLPTLGKDDL